MANKAKAPPGDDVEVVPENFTDPHWKLDHEMTVVLNEEKLTWDLVKIPTARYEKATDPDQSRTDKKDRQQAQVRSTPSMDTIASYKASLLAGERLPTPTVGPDLEMVDIYHRARAAVEADIPYIIAIRIQQQIGVWQRGVLATLRNNRHGLRMTQADTILWAKAAVQNGWSIDEAARKFRIDASSLRRALSVDETLEKATRLGVAGEFSGLRKTVQYELAAAVANNTLHETPFKDVVKLLDEHKLPGAQASKLIQQVIAQPTDTKARQVVKQWREDLTPQPAELPTVGGGDTSGNGGGGPKPPGPRSFSFKDASSVFLGQSAPMLSVLRDEAVVDALLRGTSSDAGWAKISKTLEEMRGPIEKLISHF